MKTTKLFIGVFTLLSVFSCQKEKLQIESDKSAKQESVITCTFAAGDMASKTTLDTDGLTPLWAAGDQIKIYDASNSANAGIVTLVANGMVAEAGQGEISTDGRSFTFVKPSGWSSDLCAIYPAAAFVTFDGNDAKIEFAQFQDGTFAKANICAAKTSSTTLSFKNVGAILKFSAKPAGVTKVTVPMDGLKKDYIVSFGATPFLTLVEADHPTTINLGSGIDAVYIGVPAGTIPASSTFTFKDSGDVTFDTYSTGAANTVEMNKVYNLGAISSFKNLSLTATANTYIVSSAGQYKFNATVKGNGGLDPMTGTTATTINAANIAGVKVLWEVYGQGRAIKHDGSKYDISYDAGYVYFSTPDTFVEGDVCVAIYDSENNILWSWLIWATNSLGTVDYNSKTFMDRNLGAVNVGNCMRGFLFEWGRKDAFSAANGGFDVYPYVPVAASVFSHVTGQESMDYAVLNPTVYVRRLNKWNPSWMNSTAYNAKPWRDDVKTIYDPCPIGWRVPLKGYLNNYTGFPATGLTNGYDPDEGYKGFGNPEIGYCWYSSTDAGSDQNAYAFANDYRKDTPQHWGQDQGYAIRPVRE